MSKTTSSSSLDAVAVVTEVNGIRSTLGDGHERHSQPFLDQLSKQLAAAPALSKLPIVQAFIEDISTFGVDGRLTRTKARINSGEDNAIFGLFNASYFPSLTLEYLTYRTLPHDAELADRYPSPTMPVIIEQMSKGFDSRAVVALFPENQIDGHQDSDDLIFYFIDKFVERHCCLTRLLINELMVPGSFPLLADATEDELGIASSWWVRLHEYHHRQGDMPIPEYLAAKSFKPLAGLEELRTDISSLLACANDAHLPRDMAALTYEYILAERLLRYAVEGIPRPNYDAVASQVLFNFLREAHAIEVTDGRIRLMPDLPQALEIFLSEIQSIESSIHTQDVETVRKYLLDFAKTYTDYDETASDFQHLGFFQDAKQRLNITS